MKQYLKIWITGAEGKVGKALNRILDTREAKLLDTDADDVNVTHIEEVIGFSDRNRPDVIINCAAMADIEECEHNIEDAFRVNALGPRNLSIAARKIGARIIQLSTDDVFGGNGQAPFTEFDTPTPNTIYGKSKLAGENFVQELALKHVIIRSSWLYGEGDNFVKYIINNARYHNSVAIPDDQFGTPTSAYELARFILHVIDTAEYGVYHAACEGSCSRFEYAQEILRIAGYNEDLVTAVKSPSYSVLDNFMMRLSGIYEMPHWKTALAKYIERIN